MAIQLDNSNAGVLTMAPASSGNYTLTWPATAGTSTYVLSTNGSGTLSWSAISVSANSTLTGIFETANLVGTAPPATVNIDATTATVWSYTTATANNWVLNIRGNGSVPLALNTLMTTNTVLTVLLIVTSTATAYYLTSIQIDGVAQTVRWQGGAAPTSGTISGSDLYSVTIVKTAASTYSVYASATKFA